MSRSPSPVAAPPDRKGDLELELRDCVAVAYVVERLDLSPRTARRLVRLARGPEAVATAFREGRITLLAAEAILPVPAPPCIARKSLHRHHIVFRSREGPDEPWNLTTLCAWHHQRGVHAGRIRITGRAPDGLVFELPVGRFRSGDRTVAIFAPKAGKAVLVGAGPGR